MTNRIADITVTCVVIGAERYVILWNEETRTEALRTLGRWATTPDLSFNWYHAAVASQEIRK